MSGLLDKATEYSDSVHQGDNVGSKVVNDPSAIIGAYEMGKKSAETEAAKDAVLDAPEQVPEEEKVAVFDGSGMDITNLKLQLSSIGVFLLTMILVFFVDTTVLFSGITFDDLLVPGVLVAWAVFNWEKLSQKEFDTKKLAVTGVAFLFMTGVVGGVSIFVANESAVKVGNVEFDGANNEIDVKLFGPKGADYTLNIKVDGDVQYTYESSINVDRATVSVSLDDFWGGNSLDMNDKELISYEVEVVSDGGTDTFDIGQHMVREANAAYVRVTEVFETDGDTGSKNYLGITVELLVGIGDPDAEFDFADGYFTGTAPKPIATDWDVTVFVKGGKQYDYDTISADEGVVSGVGEFAYDWVILPGTESNYLAKDDFYGDDGCYTFEVKISNEHGELRSDLSSQIQFYWDENEAGSGAGTMATAC